jgi:hypothetical protein
VLVALSNGDVILLVVLLAIPIAAIAATLVDVVIRDRDPAEQDAPTVLFAGTGEAKR